MRTDFLRHKFVDLIPGELEDGTIYISIEYATAVHRCCCGCGHEVVTPFSPTDWRMLFDGESICLEPSIGNWSFNCQSHYWIKGNEVIWARAWSKKEISSGRARDRSAKQRHFDRARSRGGESVSRSERKLNWIERTWERLFRRR